MNIRELARQAGLAIGTVSLALANSPRIAPATGRRVRELAKKVGYRPDPGVARVMSAISRRQGATVAAPILVLHSWLGKEQWKDGMRGFYDGLVSRADERKHRIELLWIGEAGMRPARVEKILASRGTEGVIVFNYPSAPATLDFDLTPYACSVIGRALVRPRLFAVDHDHHQGMLLCLEEVRRLGYRRPGLVLDLDNHERTLHCWAAAYQLHLAQLPARERIPFFLTSGGDLPKFRKWVGEHRPDAVIVSYFRMADYVRAAGFRVPGDLGLAVLFQAPGYDHLAGIDVGARAIGRRAVDLVVDQIRKNEHGLPTSPETVLIDGTWRDGLSLPAAINSRETRHR